MISKSRKARIEQERLRDVERRFLNRNVKAISFCNKHGFRVFATAQAGKGNKVKLFYGRGEKFLPLNNKLYDQNEIKEVKEYCAAIDIKYEETYNKMKDKIKDIN